MSRSLLASALAFFLLAAPASSSLVFAQEDGDAKALLARGEEVEQSKVEDAVAIYKRLLAKFPNAPQAARAHLRVGLCLAKLGKNEDARAHLREARKLGKDDDEVQREAEKALIALPPPPEPKPAEPKKPEAVKPAPAPETGPRAELQAEIDKLEAEKRELTKKAQDLEDAGKTADAYQVRAALDKKVAQIEKKKKDLAGMPRGGKPMLPGREQKREDRKAEKKAEREEKAADKTKLMLHRKEDIETAARAKLQDALVATAQNRPNDAAIAMAEFHRLRREADQLGKKAEAGKERATLEDGMKKSRETLVAAEKAGNADAAKKAREELSLAEKSLRELDSASADADRKGKLERLAGDLKRRGAPGFEVEERVAFARRELQLDEDHRLAVASVQRDIDEKKINDAEGRERTTRLDREHHKKIERLREEVETKVNERGRAEMEKELARRAEELRKNGASEADIEQRLAAARREIEPKIPGRRPEAATKLGETAGAADAGEERKKYRELAEENKRLKRRVEELEKENATLKNKKGVSDASAPN